MKKAFTLIELLVVVLIIGILAAVALPQYQTAVVKSRMATFLPLVRNILDAEEVYYLANGFYTGSVSFLGVDMPGECQHIDYESYANDTVDSNGEMFACGDDFLIDNAARDNRVSLNYCPKSNSSWDDCHPNRDFQISFMGPNNLTMPNIRKCTVLNNSALGRRICGGFGESGEL